MAYGVGACGAFGTESGAPPAEVAADAGARGDGGTPLTGAPRLGPTNVLATKQQGPLRLAVVGDNVYFTTYEGGSVCAVPVAGGPVQVLATDGKPLDVFAGATSVTWLRNTSGYTPLKSLILVDRTTTELGMVPANAPTYEHATEDAASYFVTYRYFSDWGLARTAKAPTAWSVPLVITDGRFSALASDGLHVYIASKSGIGVTTALAGDPLVPFSPGPEGALDIAVDGKSVYWLTLGGDVLRLDKDKAGSLRSFSRPPFRRSRASRSTTTSSTSRPEDRPPDRARCCAPRRRAARSRSSPRASRGPRASRSTRRGSTS
jgi:hypothetical protein